ncbi:MAG: hypothetical protein Q8Q20_02630 [bacterium]|nr:hypothetical protein [bacterium]
MRTLKQVISPRFIIALFLVGFGIISRTVFDIAPNVEFVTLLSLLAGAYLGGFWAVLVPLGIMFGSDMIIGNTNIFLFTWSAFLLGASAGLLLRKLRLNNKIVLAAFGAGMAFSIFFYLYTNFGVWLITPFYEKNLGGLLYSYYLGLPFLKLNLIGNMIVVPAGFAVAEFVYRRALGWNRQRSSLSRSEEK